jgi:hypothetical protein
MIENEIQQLRISGIFSCYNLLVISKHKFKADLFLRTIPGKPMLAPHRNNHRRIMILRAGHYIFRKYKAIYLSSGHCTVTTKLLSVKIMIIRLIILILN